MTLARFPLPEEYRTVMDEPAVDKLRYVQIEPAGRDENSATQANKDVPEFPKLGLALDSLAEADRQELPAIRAELFGCETKSLRRCIRRHCALERDIHLMLADLPADRDPHLTPPILR